MSDLIQLQPYDEYNQALESNVRPSDWQNPQPSGRYNLVVLGGGTAGLVTAAGAAGLGAKVALVERELLGGDCLNVGCVPSKGIISSARVAAAVRNASGVWRQGTGRRRGRFWPGDGTDAPFACRNQPARFSSALP